jgi:hypothetical protein
MAVNSGLPEPATFPDGGSVVEAGVLVMLERIQTLRPECGMRELAREVW